MLKIDIRALSEDHVALRIVAFCKHENYGSACEQGRTSDSNSKTQVDLAFFSDSQPADIRRWAYTSLHNKYDVGLLHIPVGFISIQVLRVNTFISRHWRRTARSQVLHLNHRHRRSWPGTAHFQILQDSVYC
ncbi:hypothetical protein MPH_04000 [Macrophomina phaseolina MS6]|uniref:Uncharacterized protein n=1 Tax=Macrophomina phaseolina (strain MS6) TaxID=1126212 RepID=K2S8P0_MACPH|nr:hypothetical protein MPH_04000 [Macrophomina phaseolina MS6]